MHNRFIPTWRQFKRIEKYTPKRPQPPAVATERAVKNEIAADVYRQYLQWTKAGHNE